MITASMPARTCGAGRWVRSGAAARAASVISAGGACALCGDRDRDVEQRSGEPPAEATNGTRDTIEPSSNVSGRAHLVLTT